MLSLSIACTSSKGDSASEDASDDTNEDTDDTSDTEDTDVTPLQQATLSHLPWFRHRSALCQQRNLNCDLRWNHWVVPDRSFDRYRKLDHDLL